MSCKHYWVCGQPIDGYVQSVCRKCGKVQSWETLVSMEHRKAIASLDHSWAYNESHLPDSQAASLH